MRFHATKEFYNTRPWNLFRSKIGPRVAPHQSQIKLGRFAMRDTIRFRDGLAGSILDLPVDPFRYIWEGAFCQCDQVCRNFATLAKS